MEDWKYAKDMEELIFLFEHKHQPEFSKPEESLQEVEKTDKTILGIKRSYFFLLLLFLLILAITLVFTAIRSKTQNELDRKNQQTELSNEKMKLRQKQDVEQQIKSEIQENITSQNKNKKRKDQITSRIAELKKLIVDDKNQLNQALQDLTDAQEYKILRSEKAKEEQIEKIQKDIDSWKTLINQLENEANRLQLELDTIH
jgi:chromosome segregation ATPase